jgi:mono/diheme cytochrome c family protein
MHNAKFTNKGRAMIEHKIERHAISASLLMLFVGLTVAVTSIARANPAPDSADAVATFRTKCVMCYVPDGAGSQVGKSMNVPDLRAPEVQRLPDAQLAQIISDGKGGMPPFKSSLSEDQIHSLVAHIRTAACKKTVRTRYAVSPYENCVGSLRSGLWKQ